MLKRLKDGGGGNALAEPLRVVSRNGDCAAHLPPVDILLVDDREDKLLALEAILDPLRHNLVKAQSGSEALQRLLRQEFAVILLDVSMPEMDGFETAALIRQRPNSEATPIIFVTAHSTSDHEISRGYSLGAVDYILSPIVPEFLRTKVSVFVDLYRKTEQLRRSQQEILNLNVELQQRLSALTEINRELESFNYSISHDLRAPLRSMQSFAEAIREDPDSHLSTESLDFLSRIIRSGRYMDNLLHDLLAYSRLARAELVNTHVDLDSALKEVLAQLHKDIEDKHAKIEIRQPLGRVRGNLPTLKQVLANLIGNALKFVDASKAPHLKIHSEKDGAFLRIWILDNGIGIAPEHHQKIFGLFERLHNGSIYPGTGVGLAIVRKGVERMGGAVGLESKLGRGSRFWVQLPEVVMPQLEAQVNEPALSIVGHTA